MRIPPGQRVLLTGPSGAGKSTLLRAVAGLLLTADHGELSGRVTLDGEDVTAAPGRVALLQQDPSAALVAETVGRDVAFGLENRRIPRAEIWPLVRAVLAATAFPHGIGHPTYALSGGETQRLALAGHLVLSSPVMLLDEPTSMLDRVSAESVRAAVRRDVEARCPTTIIVEHHIEPWLDFADRLIVMGKAGAIRADGPPAEVLAANAASLAAEGVWVPGAAAPVLEPIDPALVAPWERGRGGLITAERLTVVRRAGLVDRRLPPSVALRDVDAAIEAGQTLAVTGPSGAGKSTLVSALAGLIAPTSGAVTAAAALATKKGVEPWRWASRDLAARLSWVPQTPEHGVVARTVRDEVLATSRACGRDQARSEARADALLDTLGLGHLARASPYHLSGGEQRRLMVAASLVHGPMALLLDEPTVGQDRQTWACVLGALAAARDAGSGLAIATHDGQAVAAIADERLSLQAGVRV